jgi:hypothetical protein
MTPREQLIRQLTDALHGALQTLAAAEPSAGADEAWDGAPVFADVSARTELDAGQPARLVMTLAAEVAVGLVREMGGIEVGMDDALVGDIARELLNITVGNAQRHAPLRFSIPVPTLARGHQVELSPDDDARYVITRIREGEIGLYLIQETRHAA